MKTQLLLILIINLSVIYAYDLKVCGSLTQGSRMLELKSDDISSKSYNAEFAQHVNNIQSYTTRVIFKQPVTDVKDTSDFCVEVNESHVYFKLGNITHVMEFN